MSCHKSIVYSIILSLCLSGLLTTRVLIKADVVDDVTVNAIQQRARKLPRNFPTRWWPKYSHRDEIWYQSDEAIIMANNIISWQSPEGGWPLMNTTNEPWTGDEAAIGPWGRRGTFIGATTSEIRFLSRAYRATKDERYKQAVIKGIQFILDSQTPTGGWPKAFPLETDDYKQHMTFNDGGMINALTLMREMTTDDQYAFVGPALIDQLKERYNLGIDCILKCQILTNGKLTAWCQQHDRETYEARPGRAFEPAAICGSESIGIIKFLMQLDHPSPKVQKAIECAVQWVNDSKIEGIKVVTVPDPNYIKGFDRKVVADPNTNAVLWARYYEIETNRPIFMGRDAIRRYRMAEIEQERRTGYGWYGSWGIHINQDYKAWAAKWSIESSHYTSLDPQNPILFNGDHIIYQGQRIVLGPKAFFIDGQLTDEQAAQYPYVFNSVNAAADHLTDGTEASPMVLYLAPYVYWIDDPDDPSVRVPANGMSPFGLVIKCEWLKFYGLSKKPENVVMACNRGQTMGSRGNFTMFRFFGQGTSSENVTFGNYCNVDLEFPLKPELNREKRGSAIVQAQLIVCDGDKIIARNTHFISRLNLLPFVGGARTFFDRCHFESTDDALCTTGVYLDCTFDFYAPRPFVATTGTGAVMLNCDIRSFVGGKQYFTKLDGQMALIDTRITGENLAYVGWKDFPPPETRNYQYGVTLNGKSYLVGQNDPVSTIDMTDKPILDAYRFIHNGKVIYNTYNLLRGDDDWDPMGIKDIVLAAEKESGKPYHLLPTQLLIDLTGDVVGEVKMVTTAIRSQLKLAPTRITLETGKNDVRLVAKTLRFGNCESPVQAITWQVAPENRSFVELKVGTDTTTCAVTPINDQDDVKQVVITASTPSGLQAATLIDVAPAKLKPPTFSSKPCISSVHNVQLSVDYTLDMRFEDQSEVTWYRCTDAQGSNAIEVAVSRFNEPLREYQLSAGDIGYHIMVSVAPKHVRCDLGEAITDISQSPITAQDVQVNNKVLHTDFRNVSTQNQLKVLSGFWTFSPFAPQGSNAWNYGPGKAGALNLTGLMQDRNAKMSYTPIGNRFGDMKLFMTVAPFKTAGQGFSIAHLYMDVLVKYDATTETGYGLRFIRTTKYGNAVDCILVKYDQGKVTEISEPISTSCYRTLCEITLEVRGNRLIAHAETTSGHTSQDTEVAAEVNMETEIVPNPNGGFGIQYTGGSPTLIKEVKLEWK